ncbi:DUF1972 domain-containing protein [uncultured Spongiibacter sp.]|uniref:DUF1972 domain-containing protein n=1 Tax=uncultured Spongiibacter sp. TaxID=870896 RepID=UPI002596D2BF|nr:DUF1972 domain-containing protein [uncultured Spongiibacter sp.]
MRQLVILGIRGVPAGHGGFETFAEYLCKYLVERNWKVVVYCQEDGGGPVYDSEWLGVKRIHIPVRQSGALGTVIFDFRSIVHSLRSNGVFLTLGYNTALFNLLHRLFGKTNIINMDGIEWKRQKWGAIAKAWFWLNERFGCWFGDQLVADHPRIEDHLATRVSRRKITMIPYGGLHVEAADQSKLAALDLEAGGYSVVIARAEPENSLLEIVQGFSSRPRGHKLVVLGNYSGDNAYHRAVKAAASGEVIFPGAIYDIDVVSALRFYARFYIHGHQVGGTNPSLVEALGAGNAVLAHDNPFNRWVASDGAEYFSGADGFSRLLEKLLKNDQKVAQIKRNSASQFNARFQWDSILEQYEKLLLEHYTEGKA